MTPNTIRINRCLAIETSVSELFLKINSENNAEKNVTEKEMMYK
jgi:hypothetical protein